MSSLEEKKELLEYLNKKVEEAAQEDFLAFLRYMNPSFSQARHHEIIAEKLEAVERGDITRLMVFMPPRSGKSMMISQYFPPWYIGRNPTHQVMALSYSIDLAEQWGRFVRNQVTSDEFHKVFPEVGVSADSRAAAKWMTNKGGTYNAAGVTGGIAGKGASLALVDDPLNEQDAYSEAARNHVIRWYPGGLRTRLMPGGRIILLMTRWHENDLAGWLLEQSKDDEREQWEVLSIPALLDEDGSSLLGYPEDTTYWPVDSNAPESCELPGWPTEDLLKTRAEMPEDQWRSLYQQQPTSEEGNLIKRDYWQDWEEEEVPDCHYIFLSADTAFTTKETATGSFSAYTVWGVFDDRHDQANICMLGAKRGRWDYPTLRKELVDAFEEFKCDTMVVENRASGQSIIQDLQKIGYPVQPFKVDKDKEARASASLSIFHSKRIWAPLRKVWARDVIEECASFPRGNYDDYVDTVTQAVSWVRDNMLVIARREPWHDVEEEYYKPHRSRAFY